MSLTLMYITNRPEVADIAQRAGVDRIWVDMEYIGKEERQAGMNTVKSHHTIEDVKRLRPVVTTSELLVRVNPIHDGSRQEIEDTISSGADVIMLPMFRNVQDVKTFLEIVDGRTKTILLLETAEAAENIEEILEVSGIDEIHIGLNDLHLAYCKKFMFELLADGTVEHLCEIIKRKGIKFGFGGIARVGYGDLPAEMIMTEHYRLGSQMAILSRGFCNANLTPDVRDIEQIFIDGVTGIRQKEAEIVQYTPRQYTENLNKIKQRVTEIVKYKLNE